MVLAKELDGWRQMSLGDFLNAYQTSEIIVPPNDLASVITHAINTNVRDCTSHILEVVQTTMQAIPQMDYNKLTFLSHALQCSKQSFADESHNPDSFSCQLHQTLSAVVDTVIRDRDQKGYK